MTPKNLPKTLALSTFLILIGINSTLAQDLEPYEGAVVKEVVRCIANGNPDKKIVVNGKSIYPVEKMGSFSLVNVQAFDSRTTKFRYEKGGKSPESGKCYTKQKEKFEKARGFCCKKIRVATSVERVRLKQNYVCEAASIETARNVYNLRSKESIDFVGQNSCKQIEEGLKLPDPISDKIDCTNRKPFEFPEECKKNI